MEDRNPNHPKQGSIIRVEGFRNPADIKNIKRLLASNPRDLALFTVGINIGVRGGELLRLRIGDIRFLKPGDTFYLRESKTGKQRPIMVNKSVYEVVQALLKSMKHVNDDDYLFQSKKTGGMLTVSHLNYLVKNWAEAINLHIKVGSHSLRKSFGTINRLVHGVDIATLMRCYGHSSQEQTMRYIGVTEAEIATVYMREI